MKTLIFSDSHLTEKFDRKWFDYISNLIKDVDQVVINGDFWDAYLTTFDKFVTSEWKKLFKLLKSKKTVYIFGNHDKDHFMDERVNLFSDKQLDRYSFQSGKFKFTVLHGHVIVPVYDDFKILKNPTFIRHLYRFFVHFMNNSGPIGRKYHQWDDESNERQTLKMEKYSKDNFEKNRYFVFGHTHVSKIVDDAQYINLARFQKHSPCYLIIDDSKFDLIQERE